MKAASHELKGLQHYYHSNVPGLHFPLMAYIDYRGWRLQALSLLPIDANTLCYGSSDGGRSVETSDPQLNRLMKEAGTILNLKEHAVGPSDDLKVIQSCCDIEGHKVRTIYNNP